MEKYITLTLGILLIPLIYCGAIMSYRESFQKEENQKRIPLRSIPEIVVILSAEAAFISIWQSEGTHILSNMVFQLLYVMLVAMTFFCMADYWERVVPNRMLLVLLFLFVIIVGMQGVHDIDVLFDVFPSILLGFIFCVLSFGLSYLLSHKNMGAGDVKLSFVMGIYLTGEYVVGTILYGCIAAAVFCIVQMVRKKLSRKDKIPFVPFLYVGLIIRYLAG